MTRAQRRGVGPAERREVALLGLVLAIGVPGALPLGAAGVDPYLCLGWLAFVAPAAGFVAGALGQRAWPWGLAAPATWMALVALVDVASPRDLPSPLWAALAWSGLYALGLGLGTRAQGAPWPGAGILLLASALLVGLPVRGGLGGASWAERSPALGAALFDLSPATLLFESAGVDWMRHSAVYAPAGTDWFAGRQPYSGSLAGPAVFMLGCAAALAARRRERAIPGPDA